MMNNSHVLHLALSSLLDQGAVSAQTRTLLLILAIACVLLALRVLRHMLEPVGALLRTAAGVVVAVLALAAAVVLLAAAVVVGH